MNIFKKIFFKKKLEEEKIMKIGNKIILNRKFSTTLKELRVDRNLSQTDLAKMLSIKRQAISNWERGLSKPSVPILMKICKIFDIELKDFM